MTQRERQSRERLHMHNSTRTTRRANAEAGVSLLKRRTWHADEADETVTPPANGGTAGSEEKLLPQSEVNKIAADRAKRAALRREAEILSELEVDDLAAAKVALAEFRKGGNAAKALADRIAALEKERDDARKALDDSVALRRLEKRNDGLIQLARTAKADIPDDIIVWAEKNAAELLAAALNADGTLNADAAQKVIDACKVARPAWFKVAPGSPSNANGRPAGLPQKDPSKPTERKFSL